MIVPGLVSVSFRQLTPTAIIQLAQEAELKAIEWGGDVHVPHGDLVQARRVRSLCDDAGIHTPTYGSYYRAGHPESGPFSALLETAIALGASTVRVWAGRLSSAEADQAYRQRVIDDTRQIAELAAASGLTVAYEYHGNTLTDSVDSALRLLTSANHPALRCLWQPPKGSTEPDNLAAIDRLAPWLAHVHVFSWRLIGGQTIRLPLDAYAGQWQAYLARMAALPGHRCALLEFVRNDDPAQCLADATVLKRWLSKHG